jgi:hypothetical protein
MITPSFRQYIVLGFEEGAQFSRIAVIGNQFERHPPAIGDSILLHGGVADFTR